MSRPISERDWKVFREVRETALARFSEKILVEAQGEIERPSRSAHDRYRGLLQHLQKRDDDIGRAFDDFRRSTAVMQLGMMHSMDLLTADELSRFSTETRQELEVWASIRKG